MALLILFETFMTDWTHKRKAAFFILKLLICRILTA